MQPEINGRAQYQYHFMGSVRIHPSHSPGFIIQTYTRYDDIRINPVQNIRKIIL